MFTGIITDVGTVEGIDKSGDWIFDIAASSLLHDIKIGASVACNGICLTVIEATERSFRVQASQETLETTTARRWSIGDLVNLERATRVGDELGGHFVSGHVDGTARIVTRVEEKESIRFRFQVPDAYALFLAPKGSIALDGISLTINEVEGPVFGVNIIPHTQLETSISERRVGDLMNFEVDLIARYVARVLDVRGQT